MNKTVGNKPAKTRDTARRRLADREAEMERLQKLWEQAQEQGKLVLISGPGGVGKTRLLEELGERVGTSGAGVARGQCVVSGRSAYRPWCEVLRTLLGPVERANEVLMKRIGPVLAALLPELWARPYLAGQTPPVELDPQAAQLRLNSAIVRLLRAAAEIRPTLVVIEDAHWADEASLALLTFLARVPRLAGLLVGVTWCDEGLALEHPLRALPDNQAERIALSPLPLEATADLARSMLGLNELPAALIERLQQAAGGNPLLTQELICAWAEEGAILQSTVDGWRVNETALRATRLPEGLPQVIEQRLARLSPEVQAALRGAAVVGSVFWDGSVEAVSQLSEPQARAALEEGLDQGWLIERPAPAFEGEREYLFANAAVREVCYANVPQGEQSELHRRAAAWLKAQGDEQVKEHLGLLAEQLDKAGQVDQAVIYLRRAGEQAAGLFANAEAVAYLSRALELTPEGLSPEYYAVLSIREKVYDLRGVREAQRRDLAALQKLAEMMGDAAQPQAVGSRRAEVALRQARYAEATGDYVAAIAAAQKAIELARHVQDASSEAAGHMQWGFALRRQGEYQAARLELEQAIILAQTAGAGRVETDSLGQLAFLCTQQGDYAGARLRAEQAQRRCREMGDRQGESYAGNVLGNAFSEQGDYTQGQACFEQSLQICREIGDRWGEAMRLVNLGWVSLDQGHYAQATQYLELALQTSREIGDPSEEGEALNLLGSVWMAQGRYDQAQDCFEQALRIFRKIGNQEGECWALSRLGLLSCNVGDPQAAQEYSQRALSIGQKIQSAYQSHALTNLGHALLGLNRPAEAAEYYRQAGSLQRGWGQHKLAIESLAGLARAAQAQADLPQALACVDEILGYLKDHTLEGAKEPFRVYWTCYCVLQACQDSRAQDILATAHHLLQEQAAQITDDELRRSFLENVAVHREIIQEFARRQPAPAPDTQAAEPMADKSAQPRRQKTLPAGLEHAQETLWEGENPFRAIAETASDAIIILDADENIFFWNQAAQDIFGYWAGETGGHLLASILTPDFCQAFRTGMEQVVTTGRSDMIGRPIEVIGVRQDRSQFPLELSLSTWKTKDKVLFTAIGRDVTERKQAEAERETLLADLERRALQLQAAAEISRAAGSILDPNELIRQAVNLIRERLDLYYVGLFLVNDPRQGMEQTSGLGQWAVLRAGTGEAGRQMLERGHKLEVGSASLIGWCLAHKQARIALDVGAEAGRFDNPLLPETHSEIALPLISRGEAIGALTIQSSQQAAFSEEDIAALQTMAGQIANAIENARLFEGTAAALREMEATQRRYLRQAWTEYRQSAETINYETERPGVTPLGDAVLPEVQQAMEQRGVTVLTGDGAEGKDRSALVSPIVLRGEIIGALGIHAEGETRQWTKEEIALVEAVAERMALAAENLRLLDETQRRAERERVIREISDKMRRAANMDELMQIAIREMAAAQGASSAFVQWVAPPTSTGNGGNHTAPSGRSA